jgi:hypothetical protein
MAQLIWGGVTCLLYDRMKVVILQDSSGIFLKDLYVIQYVMKLFMAEKQFRNVCLKCSILD